MIYKFINILLLIVCVFSGHIAAAQETKFVPDFFLDFRNCKSVIGYNDGPANNEIKVFDNIDSSLFGCSRHGREIRCAIAFKSGGKLSYKHENVLIYKLQTETATELIMYTPPNGGDYINVDRGKGIALSVSRALHDKFTGAKVCKGGFHTMDEMTAEISG